MAPIVPKFTPGLNLIHVDFHEINDKKVAGNGLMTVNVAHSVPQTTKAVHVAVIRADVSFGTCDAPVPDSFGRIMYEITNTDDSQLSNGLFKFDFQAILRGPHAAASWCGHFLLEVLCFG